MAGRTPKLLLVSHADHAQEVIESLAEHGYAEPLVGAGGDETLDVFEESNPDVVIMVAGLAEGDEPALASAMRSGHYGRPAPIIFVVNESEGIEAREAAKNSDFARVVQRPLSQSEFSQAVNECWNAATGARMNAAMDQAIESFVSDAMVSLSSESLIAPSEPVSAQTPEPEPASWTSDSTAMLRSNREPTAVLGEDLAGLGPLSNASQALLDEVLPGETLDVDLDELDAVGGAKSEAPVQQKSSDSPPGPPEPSGGGDFARQLRLKMSAMAERLFPGQGEEERTATISPINAAHTEIDLGAIPEEGSPDVDQDGSETNAVTGLEESGITMARETGAGSSASLLTRPRVSGTDGQALVGTLDAAGNDIAAVIARLWKRGFSGCLVLVRDQEEKRVQFEAGRIVFASSTHEADRMGQLLLRQGKINSEQLATCRQQVAATGRRLGEILVDQGHLKPRELLPAVRHHLEDIVYSVFAWTIGSYDALPEHTIEERIRLSKHPAALIVEGIRRKYDRQRLENCLGGMGQVLVTVKGDEQLSTIAAADLSGPEGEAQRLFDGEHTLDDARAESKLEGLRVAQLAYAWICLGIAELVDRSREQRPERSASAGYLVGETDLAIDRQRVRAKHLLVQEADYFQLLGVRPDASAFEIRRAYESALHHFGREGFPAALQEELGEQLEEINAVIEEAYLVLSDDQIRSKYRANLR